MEINIEDVKLFSTLAKPIIDPIISTLITPNIHRLNKWVTKQDRKNKIEDNFWENKFSSYLETIYRDSLGITTLVFPNSRTKIKDLYIPLSLIETSTRERFKIDEYDKSLFTNYPKILIQDYAGMGKSTLLKWITLSIIEENHGVPILIELRKIDDSNSLVDELLNQLSPIDNSFDKELIYELLELGFFTILLDGFDEIPYDIQDKVTGQISSFIKKASKNNFILTSRPESALSTFFDFQLFYIQPLQQLEAFELIRKLDTLSKVKFGESLITEIEEKNPQVKEFLTNPFLVSLLYKSYTYNKDIPSKKITFYEEVYSCLFKHHDLSKEGFKRPKKSRLDILDFERILRDVAFETSKTGQVIYSKDELLSFIIKAKKMNSGIDFKEQNFLDDLTTTVPIFVIEGQKIKWAHKSIQDFFSAKYISNHLKKEEIIETLFASNKYQYLNILDLLFEFEPKLFRKIITKKILESYINFHDTQFLKKPNVKKEELDIRIGLTFSSKYCFIKPSEKTTRFEEVKKIFAQAIGKDAVKGSSTLHLTNVYSIQDGSMVSEVINILGNKNENLFITEKRFSNDDIDAFSDQMESDKAYIIDDNIDAVYNKPEYFSGVTHVMNREQWNGNNRRTYVLDYQKCIEKLKEINDEIQAYESDDLLSNI